MDISEKNLEETIEQVLLSRPATVAQLTQQGLHLPAPLYGPGTSMRPDDVAPGGYRKHLSAEEEVGELSCHSER
jgi:hypothetical protein